MTLLWNKYEIAKKLSIVKYKVQQKERQGWREGREGGRGDCACNTVLWKEERRETRVELLAVFSPPRGSRIWERERGEREERIVSREFSSLIRCHCIHFVLPENMMQATLPQSPTAPLHLHKIVTLFDVINMNWCDFQALQCVSAHFV